MLFFNKLNEMIKFIILNRDQHPYRCSVCDEEFQLWSELCQHKKTHEHHIKLKCKQCPKLFESRVGLIEHQAKTHTGGNLTNKSQFLQRSSWKTGLKCGWAFWKRGIRTYHPELRSIYSKKLL